LAQGDQGKKGKAQLGGGGRDHGKKATVLGGVKEVGGID